MNTPDPDRTACPDANDWKAFVVGDLARARFDVMAAHLIDCQACDPLVRELDGHADELVGDLRCPPPTTSEEPLTAAVVAAAEHACQQAALVGPGRSIAASLRSGPYQLGRFTLFEELGVGSFGHVFRAQDSLLDRTVAVKIQRAPATDSDEDRARLMKEARSIAQLEHPGIVSLYEAGSTEDGIDYLVTEFVEGITLEKSLADGPRDHQSIVKLMSEIAMAVQYAHAHGIIHRDIKPSNILVDRDGRPHITDFGLAKRDVGDGLATPDGEIMGTPAYMSPELARGDAPHVDARSDIFSLGVIMYELLVGQRPFAGNRRMLLRQVLEDDPQPPRRLDETIPRDLETICLKAMAKAPARRYGTAQEFADDLLRFERGEAIRARPVSRVERVVRWCRRNPVAVVVLAVITLGSMLGFWHLTDLSRDLVRQSALESAEQYSDFLDLVNEVYSTEVVERIGNHGVQAVADFAKQKGTIPLPATMMALLLCRLGDTDSGMRGRQFSSFPFRPDGGPHDEFERSALSALGARPSEPFYRFVDDYGGHPVLRYARARVMRDSCVACHNARPDSPKQDWKIGDVRGVLEIIRPLDSDTRRIHDGLRGTFMLVLGVTVALLGLALFVLLFARGRRS